MPVQAPPVAREPSAPLPAREPDRETDLSFDARWNAWIERGRQHDLAVKGKLRIALLCAAAIGVLVAIFFGVAAGAR
jgi:hypothetical protein